VTASPEELESAGLNAESVTALKLVVEAADQLAAARSQRPAHLAVLYLNNRNQLLAEQSWPADASAETLPGQVARRALEIHATALILVCCRPDHPAVPNKMDVALGRQITAAADVLSIVLHDSLVIGAGGAWASLKRKGGL
jgi:DNA repair protein RadC